MIGFELTEEQKALRKLARDFAEKEIAPVAAELDEKEEFSRELFDKMGELGFAGMLTPPEYGGIGLSYVSFCIVMEELSVADLAIPGCLVPHTGQEIVLLKYATEEQKHKFVTPLARGKKLGAFCATESNAGSDVAGIQSIARLQGDNYVIDGNKIFTTNGGEADQYLVIARSTKEEGARGLSGFIVEKGNEGLSYGRKERKMGFRACSTRELIFENCAVPRENLIGKEGQGFYIAMELFDYARVECASSCVALAQAALDAAIEYAKQRVQFGQPIAEFQGIQFMLADMATQVEAARLLTYYAADRIDQGLPASKEAAMCKVFASDMAMKVTIDAVQIFGGYGYMKDYPVERYMRDAKIGQIYDGTNQIQRMIIARHLLKSPI